MIPKIDVIILFFNDMELLLKIFLLRLVVLTGAIVQLEQSLFHERRVEEGTFTF